MEKLINKALKKLRKGCEENVEDYKNGTSAFNDFDNTRSGICLLYTSDAADE